jgi:hypothetical protein
MSEKKAIAPKKPINKQAFLEAAKKVAAILEEEGKITQHAQ